MTVSEEEVIRGYVAIEPFEPDLDSDPAPTDYTSSAEAAIVGSVGVLSADQGVGKTTLYYAEAVARATGQPKFAGFDLYHPENPRTLVLDYENSRDLIHNNLKALGLTTGTLHNLRVFAREALFGGPGQIGTPKANRFLEDQIKSYRPLTVVIDTWTSGCDADLSIVKEIAAIYNGLRPLASEYACAIVLLLHERKPSLNDSGDKRSFAVSGSRSLLSLAEFHSSLAVASKLAATEHGMRTQLYYRPAMKPRYGALDQTWLLNVESTMKDYNGRKVIDTLTITCTEAPVETVTLNTERLGPVFKNVSAASDDDGWFTIKDVQKYFEDTDQEWADDTIRAALRAHTQIQSHPSNKRGRKSLFTWVNAEDQTVI